MLSLKRGGVCCCCCVVMLHAVVVSWSIGGGIVVTAFMPTGAGTTKVVHGIVHDDGHNDDVYSSRRTWNRQGRAMGIRSIALNLNNNERRTTTRVYRTTRDPPIIPMPNHISYGEESRRYRRTIYTHDDWIKHRAPNRFFNRAMSIFRSGIYSNIKVPVLCVTIISTLTIMWNAMIVGWTGIRGMHHAGIVALSGVPPIGLPMAPFTLSSASLGLLLVFRTNTGYARWDEARKNWGMNINRTRDLFRMAVAWYDEKAVGGTTTTTERRRDDLTVLAQSTWAFVRCMKRHLSPAEDENEFQAELYDKLPARQAQTILQARHRPNRALFDLSMAIENLPMHFLRKSQLHLALTTFEDNLGSSERLLSSPVPLFYSRHTARFLLFWMFGLPLALYKEFANSWNHILLIPASAFIATFLFGIEELANQMEEPFTILPQQAFCDKIYEWCTEMVEWKPGDNGLKVNDYASMEHYTKANGSYSSQGLGEAL